MIRFALRNRVDETVEILDHYLFGTPMIVISKKLFCLILVGLSTLAVTSLCSILQLPIHQAIIVFLVTWVGMVGVFELGDFFNSEFPQGPPKQQR